MKKIISILARNRPGVLSHVAGLVTRRGYNVESIAAGPTENHAITRITLVVTGDAKVLEQVTKQFRKLVDIIKVDIVPHSLALTGELALVTVSAPPEKRSEILNLVGVLGVKIKNVGEDSLTLFISGSARSVDAAVKALYPFEIKSMARTGLVALPLEKGEEEED
ncbi:MAG: acetolactate synthase small subunit [Deltaproteobacteria bacterium]|jgi:acetolactate synthase-1/3 small subunit|nr:acetolactate synthase small subunit [Deltaproteobacteria bacterium]